MAVSFPFKDRGDPSATIVPSLWLILACSALFLLSASASDPSGWNDPGWWTAQGAMTTNSANNNAIANQGQLKQFTSAAVKELNADLASSGGAGPALSNLVFGWQQDYASNGYATNTANPSRPYKPSDYWAVNVGQLKYIGSLVYGRLYDLGYIWIYPSWISQNAATDGSAANLGQLKTLFNFDFSLAGPTNLTVTPGTSGTLTLNWSNPTTNSATSYEIEQQLQNGSWTNIADITNLSTSSYSISNLAPGENPAFQIVAQNGAKLSSAQGTPADTGLVSPSNVVNWQGQAPGEIDMSWQNNATDATYNAIWQSSDNVNWTLVATVAPTTAYYAVFNLTIGQNYYFAVSYGNISQSHDFTGSVWEERSGFGFDGAALALHFRRHVIAHGNVLLPLSRRRLADFGHSLPTGLRNGVSSALCRHRFGN